MIFDEIAPEPTGIPTPGSVAGSAAESSPQAPPIIPFSQPVSKPQVTAEVAPAPERSLRDIYTGHAVRYRELGQKQMDGNLSTEETIEREELSQIAGFGLFAENLSEEQLMAKDAAYKAHIEAEAKELEKPQALAARYRALGIKLIDSGLTPDELAEYNRLNVYAKRGKLELPKAA